MPIITKWNNRILYIDGFAGPGEYKNGQDGSPVVAIKSILEHRSKNNLLAEIIMIFIEDDKERHEFLRKKIESFKLPTNIKTDCILGKFNDVLVNIFNNLDEQKKRLAPSFVFIDPFGFSNIPFGTIKKIMENKKCEVLITFMFEEINRFIGDERLWDNLKELFGTDNWKSMINLQNPKDRLNVLHDIYKNQLENEAKIQFVRSFKMINKQNKTDYFLFFGTNDLMGLKKMKEAMWKVDKGGSFQFSDATYNPSQPLLFEIGPDFDSLKKTILLKFRGKIVSIKELENFVLIQTPFRETHYKKQILVPMEKESPPSIKRICKECRHNKDCKKRKTFFKEDCIIEFL